jgi:hypothetical protein
MFRQSAPWLKDAPRYSPQEHENSLDSRRVIYRSSHDSKHRRSAQHVDYQFVVVNPANVEEGAPKRRLCKNDTRRLRRFQNTRMRIASTFRIVAMTMLMFGWLIPIYLVSHAAAVCAIAHKCGTLIQSALANSALKTWLGTVHTA